MDRNAVNLFPLFTGIFIVFGIVRVVYSFKNATRRNRNSLHNFTDLSEERDSSDGWGLNEYERTDREEMISGQNTDLYYCPFCGAQIEDGFFYCPKCGKPMQ